MSRRALSLALALPLTLAVACDQPVTAPIPNGDAVTTGRTTGDRLALQINSEPEASGRREQSDRGSIETVLALEGSEVLPQTLLHLESAAADCDGQAQAYRWTVTQPAGSMALLAPSATHATPTFQANVAGDYTFVLESFGPDEELCTLPRFALLSVMPETLVHIELLWHTPGDPDETDEGPEAGSDLDLHVQRVTDGDLAGGWFDPLFDCFWFNPHPDWGSFDPTVDDDPGLDLDDTDGAGPEIFSLNLLEQDATYAIMVHSWSDHGYGGSLATVRVFIGSELVYETEEVLLTGHDAWEVGTLQSDLIFSPSIADDGGPAITPDFTPNTFFATP